MGCERPKTELRQSEHLSLKVQLVLATPEVHMWGRTEGYLLGYLLLNLRLEQR